MSYNFPTWSSKVTITQFVVCGTDFELGFWPLTLAISTSIFIGGQRCRLLVLNMPALIQLFRLCSEPIALHIKFLLPDAPPAQLGGH